MVIVGVEPELVVCSPAGCDPDPGAQGRGQDIALIIVSVLPDDVDAPRGAGDDDPLPDTVEALEDAKYLRLVCHQVTPNRKTVFSWYISPRRRTVDGKFGLLGESG